jgi:biotin carboxyl carrier protein
MEPSKTGGDAMNVSLIIDGKLTLFENFVQKAHEVSFTFRGTFYAFRSTKLSDGLFILERELSPEVWKRETGCVSHTGTDHRCIQVGGVEAKIAEANASGTQSLPKNALCPPAPMSGVVHKILVSRGDNLQKGQAFAVMEAMKVQTTLTAGANAVVEDVFVREGDVIAEGTELVRLSATKVAP